MVEKNIVHVSLSETINKRRNHEKHFLASCQKFLCCGIEDFVVSGLDSVIIKNDDNLFIDNCRVEFQKIVFS